MHKVVDLVRKAKTREHRVYESAHMWILSLNQSSVLIDSDLGRVGGSGCIIISIYLSDEAQTVALSLRMSRIFEILFLFKTFTEYYHN